MGAIQGSINQMVGTAAIAAAAGKHAIEAQKQAEAAQLANEEKALVLENDELPKREADVTKADEAIAKHLEEHKALDTPAEEGILAAEAASGDDALPDSLTKAREALDTMNKQRLAKIAMRDYTKDLISRLRGGK